MAIAGLNALVAIGFALLLGQAGQISLGQATFFGIGGYTSAILTTKFGMAPLLALAIGALAAAAVAYGVGIPVLRLRGIMLVLVTMAMGEIFYIFTREAMWLTGGMRGISGIPWLAIGGFVIDDYLRQYYVIWAFVLAVLLFSERAIRSRAGRAMRALAIDEPTASTLGIHTPDWKLVAFVVSAIYAGIAGGLYAFVMSTVNPEDFGFMLSMVVLIMVMIGGMNSLSGAVAGSILMTWLVRSFSGFQEYSGIIYAVVLIILVIFLPGGITGGMRSDQIEWLRRRFKLSGRVTPARADGELSTAGSASVLNGNVRANGPIRLNPLQEGDRVPSADANPLLNLEGISVSFGGLRAVNQVSLTVSEGAIAALIGPNGAGKTTLFNVINGLLRPEMGRIWFAGQEITRCRAENIARLGMARTFQTLHIFPNMTVLENVMTGRHRHERSGFVAAGLGLSWQLREEENSRERGLEALRLVGLEDRANWPAIGLPYGQQRLLEIARALATEPRLLLLDEPTAGLNSVERMQLMERVTRIRDAGITVLLVEHDMELVMGISDTVSVLNYGKLIAEGTPEEVQNHPAVIEAYLGVKHARREPSGFESTVSVGDLSSWDSGDKEPLLHVDGISTYYGSICAIRDVALQVPSGEIVAVLGANGAGKTTLLRTISGTLRPRNGRIVYQSREISRLSPPEIAAGGIGHVPEGRHVFPTLCVHDNLRLGAYRRHDRDEIRRDLESVYELFPVLNERRLQIAGTLSGGEQQMLAIGRALMGRPKLLLLDEPSMGLAPLVVQQVFETLVTLNRRGVTLLMVEQNAEMALSIAHRAFVLQIGRVALSGPAAHLRQDERVRSLYLGQQAVRA